MNQELQIDAKLIGDISEVDLDRWISKSWIRCEECSQPKLYVCMEPLCPHGRGLLCPQQDVFSLNGKHFNHNFSYVKGTLKFQGFDPIKENLKICQRELKAIQNSLKDYLKLIQQMDVYIVNCLDRLQKLEHTSNYSYFKDNIKKLQFSAAQEELFKIADFLLLPLQEIQQNIFQEMKQIFEERVNFINQAANHKKEMNYFLSNSIRGMTVPKQNLKKTKFLLNRQKLQTQKPVHIMHYSDCFKHGIADCKLTNDSEIKSIISDYQKCFELKISSYVGSSSRSYSHRVQNFANKYGIGRVIMCSYQMGI